MMGANGWHPGRSRELSVIIPAFNEEDRLPAYLERVLRYLRDSGADCEVIVVDDGSLDRTAELVQAMMGENPELEILRLPANRGKGCAVRTGMLRATGKVRLFTDADGATPIEELARLRDVMEQGADIAVASRTIRDTGSVVRYRVHRKVIGSVFNAIVRFMAVRGVSDTQCGFKLFTGESADDIFAYQTVDGFGFDVEVLFIARERGYRVVEVPVNWADVAGSKVSLFRDSLLMLRDVLRVRLNSLRGCYRARPAGLTRAASCAGRRGRRGW